MKEYPNDLKELERLIDEYEKAFPSTFPDYYRKAWNSLMVHPNGNALAETVISDILDWGLANLFN